MGGSLQSGNAVQPVESLPEAERSLSARDPKLSLIIRSQQDRWPTRPTEDPIWGLIRIVMAQQISTAAACRLAERVRSAYPMLTNPSPENVPGWANLRAFGLSELRSRCCVTILQKSEEIRHHVQQGKEWEDALAGIKGLGPWTLAVFRIMVLRLPDELPLEDVGLQRAVANVYGGTYSVERAGKTWRPFRSVACWYLWRTLGNEQLG